MSYPSDLRPTQPTFMVANDSVLSQSLHNVSKLEYLSINYYPSIINFVVSLNFLQGQQPLIKVLHQQPRRAKGLGLEQHHPTG